MLIETLPVGVISANAYIVYRAGEKEALIIDPGDDAPRILRLLQEKRLELKEILLTHGHFDHILAAPILRKHTGAKISIGKKDAPMLSDAALNLYRDGMSFTPFQPFEADELLPEGEITRCGFQIHVIRTPGHTPGGVCYDFPQEDALFTGDTLFDGGYGRTDFPGGDYLALHKSLLRLMDMPKERPFYPGHGTPSTILRARRDFA